MCYYGAREGHERGKKKKNDSKTCAQDNILLMSPPGHRRLQNSCLVSSPLVSGPPIQYKISRRIKTLKKKTHFKNASKVVIKC